MIPEKLTIKNFMCYRDNVPPLSFNGIHVACLGGANGNGKSAIFDAMTWTLWGESRAKSDDDLIHLGQSEMEVELEFMARDQRYRVIRKRTKRRSASRAGQTVLELQIANNDSFKPISGNNLPETQQKIIKLLRLDYLTFKNSAFLRQGHADEFSIKRPGERKEILANILGLSQYDELESMSKDLAVRKRGESNELQNSIAEITSQLAGKDEYEIKVQNVKHDLSQLEERKKNKESIISALRLQKESLELKREQLSNTESRISEIKQEVERWQEKSKEHRAKINEYEKILAERAAIEKGYSDFVETRSANDEFNQKLSRLLIVREHIKSLENTIRLAAQSFTIEHEKIQTRIAEKETKHNKIPQLEETLIQTRNSLIESAKLEEEIAEKREQAQQITSQISYLVSTDTQLEEEISQLEEKRRLLTQDDVRCPLCETVLGTDGRQRLEVKLALEADDKSKTKQTINEELTKRKSELQALQSELAQSETTVSKERAEHQSRLGIVEKELAEARQAGEELVQEKNKLVEVEQCLSRKDYATSEQQALVQLEEEEKNLGYDKERHQYLQQRLVELQKYESLKQELDEVNRSIGKEKAALSESEESISNLNNIMKTNLNKRDTILAEIATLSDTVSTLVEVEQDYQTLLEDERQIRDNFAALQERLRYLAELEVLKQEKEKLYNQATREESIYKELAEAFSKKGVQALLIMQAFPEIENEANRLLGKMTDNRLSLTLESQREMRAKKGDTIETLDIKIADELGTRNYEMYSGGEAFRIDIALRIALSKLLVRRAGASLPILIIDEGFGTQDSSGRERLVEAINSIQDDFEKIFVITHLEEMKDSFPVLINVDKTPNGSMISIS